MPDIQLFNVRKDVHDFTPVEDLNVWEVALFDYSLSQVISLGALKW